MKRCADMPYHTGIQLRIYPGRLQKTIIAVNDGVSRFVYNRLTALNNERYELSKTADLVPCYKERISFIDSILRSPDTALPSAIKNSAPFLYGELVDSLAIDNAIKNYRSAWKKFREDPHAKAPSFHKKGYELSYRTNAHYYRDAGNINDGNVRFEDEHHLVLPIIGRIRFAGSMKRVRHLMDREDTRIGSIRVFREADGRYYVSLQVSSMEPFCEPLPKTGAMAGIDLNIENFLYDSDGNRVDNPKYRRSTQRKLARRQRRMARKAVRAKKENRPLGSSVNYQKDRKAAAHLQAQIRARGENFRHTVSRQYVENQDIIAVEDLKVRNLMKNHKLALCISEVGWSDFLSKLGYKAGMYGKTFIKVPPHMTTQTCSECGYVLQSGERLSLDDREWTCPHCGSYHVRDHNSSKVILTRGLKALGLK